MKSLWKEVETPFNPEDKILHRPAWNGGCLISNGIEISSHHSYNGSGKSAFAGVDRWPAITIRIMLPAGRYDLQDKLVKETQDLIDKFIVENNIPARRSKP